MSVQPTDGESANRDSILAELKQSIRENRRLLISPHGQYPLEGGVGPYLYSFEGEDDLLHLKVECKSGEGISVEEAQAVVAFVLPGVAPGLIWLKPGVRSHHFYIGHDQLLETE